MAGPERILFQGQRGKSLSELPQRAGYLEDRQLLKGHQESHPQTGIRLLAFGNIGDFITVEEGGSAIVDFGTATREQMASLKSLEIDERTIDGAAAGMRRVKISMSDKRQALMDLAKIARMLPADRLEHSGSLEHRHVRPEHKIDIEAMDHDEREQLRTLLLKASGDITDVEEE